MSPSTVACWRTLRPPPLETRCHPSYGILVDSGTLQAVLGLMTIYGAECPCRICIDVLTPLPDCELRDHQRQDEPWCQHHVHKPWCFKQCRSFGLCQSYFGKVHRGHVLDGMAIGGGILIAPEVTYKPRSSTRAGPGVCHPEGDNRDQSTL